MKNKNIWCLYSVKGGGRFHPHLFIVDVPRNIDGKGLLKLLKVHLDLKGPGYIQRVGKESPPAIKKALCEGVPRVAFPICG